MPTVREAIRIVTADGWRLKDARGSHRHYVHSDKPGKVTIAGKPSRELPPGTWKNIMKQAGLERGRFQ